MTNIYYNKAGMIFNQHSYWTKQPLEAIEYFIKKYSKTNDVILDPFCGSGMTGLASQINERNCILSDISKACLHISEGYNQALNFKINELENFIKNLESKLNKFFYTQCKYCKKKKLINYEVIGEFYEFKNNLVTDSNEYFNFILNNKKFNKKINKNKFHSFKTIKICYKCDCRIKKIYKNPDLNDLKIYKKIDKIKIDFPNNLFFGKEVKRNFKKNIFKVKDLYSTKNLYAINIINKEILKIKNKNLKKFFLFCFSSILFNCSLMSRFRKYENTSINMGTFYVPSLIKDNNPLLSFSRKVFKNYKAKIQFLNNNKKNNVKILNMDATKMKQIKNNSIDFIYTDPPYLDILNYSELNIVWEAWLNLKSNYDNEMIVCETEKKSSQRYYELFNKFINEASRVLKKNKFLVLIFNHPEISTWANIQKIIINSKFEIVNSKLPFRIISDNKTSSQIKTNKKSQSFICLILKNKKINNTKKLINLSFDQYLFIKKEAKKNMYITKDQEYDYFINKCLNKFNLSNISFIN